MPPAPRSLALAVVAVTLLLPAPRAAAASPAPAAPRSAAAAGPGPAAAAAPHAGAAPSPAVRVGLERLGSPAARVLRGARVGLIVNAASVTRAGTPAVDVLRAHGIHVARLFTPEHGLSASAAAGAGVADGRDPHSGLPVTSLYGAHTAPTAQDLAGLDALVYDLQDAGVRFFTFGSTELLALRAAAAAHVRFVVLDRPDPLGGNLVAGPLRDGPESFVATTPGPLVHGLTAGELARYANAHAARKARLTVVPMTGWRRAMTWAQTGRRWVPPSPNLRTPEAALLYPGTALFEATNVSEGRGTAAPFLTVCAPFLDAAGLAAPPGAALTPGTVVPRASAAAPAPKFAGTSCPAVRLRPLPGVDGFRAGLTLLRELRTRPQFAWLEGGAGIDALVGTTRLRRALDRGASVAAILAAEAPGLRAWRLARGSALLYR